MSMVINTNMDSLRVYNMYNQNSIGLQSSMYKVASGKRINFAGDDPSGIGIAERVRNRIDSSEQAKKNIQNDNAVIKMADGALSNMSEVITNIKEKVLLASNSSVTSTERSQIKLDIDELMSRYDDIVKDAKYGGQTFFDSAAASSYTTTGFRVQYGPDGGDGFSITFDKLDKGTQGLTASNISNKITGAFVTSANVTSAITQLDTALNNVVKAQAKIGTYEQRLGYLSDTRTNEITALTELESSVRDTDMAKGMTDFMKYNILTQASQLMLAQAGQNPSMVLRLLE